MSPKMFLTLSLLLAVAVASQFVFAQLQPFQQQYGSGGNSVATSSQSSEHTVRTTYQQPAASPSASIPVQTPNFQSPPAIMVVSQPVQTVARYSSYPARATTYFAPPPPPPPPPSLLLADFTGSASDNNNNNNNNNQQQSFASARNNNRNMPSMPQFQQPNNNMGNGVGSNNNLFGDNNGGGMFDTKISCFTCRASPGNGAKCDPGPSPTDCPWVFQTSSCFQAQIDYTPVVEGSRQAPPPKGSEISYGCLNDVSFPYMFVKNQNGFNVGNNECKQFDNVEINTDNQNKYRLSGRICTCPSSGCNLPQ